MSHARVLAGIGAASAFLSVAFGAFAAHALRGRLAPDLLATFETGARYQMYHALAIILVVLMASRLPQGRRVLVAGWFFVVGTVLFSGSLYALAFTGATRLGLVTPVGGLCFLVGWVVFVWNLISRIESP